MAAKGRPKKYTDADLLQPIHEFVDEHGRPPSKSEYNEVATASGRTLYDRFGSHGAAIEAAGYEPHDCVEGSDSKYTERELLQALRDRAAELGHPPRTREMNDADDYPCHVPYNTHFGPWENALAAAGLDPDEKPTDHAEPKYSDADLLEWIDAFVQEFGVVPTSRDLKGWPGPSHRTYAKRFESVAEAVREAGYTPRGDR